MHCNRVTKLLLEYLDDELRDGLRIKVDTHLVSCPHCKQELGELKRDMGLLKLPEEPLRTDVFWESFTSEAALRLNETASLSARNDVSFVVIARSKATWQSILYPLLRFGMAAAIIVLIFKLSFYKMPYTQFQLNNEIAGVDYSFSHMIDSVVESAEGTEGFSGFIADEFRGEFNIEEYAVTDDKSLEEWFENLSDNELDKLKSILEESLKTNV